MKLEPYIFFYGRCEEALEFYKSTIGGTYELNRIDNKIMHASFQGDGFSFLASDGDLSKSVDPDAGNVSLSLTLTDAAQAERVFKSLSQGGNVRQPFGDAFWGGKFGVVVDRFGTEWMLSSG